jgi:hypothetical protein
LFGFSSPVNINDIVNEIIALWRQQKGTIRNLCLNFAQRYDLKSETLRTRVKAALRPKDHNHGNQRFSNEDESTLAGVCLAFASKGTLLSPKEAIEIMRFWNTCSEE